jgi:uncharacterized protein
MNHETEPQPTQPPQLEEVPQDHAPEIIPPWQPSAPFLQDGPLFGSYQDELPPTPRFVPNLGHTAIFFILAFLMLAVGQGLGLVLMQQTHFFGHKSLGSLARMSTDDPRLTLPVQGFSYLLVAIVVIPVFAVLWRRPFAEGIHWSASVARRRFIFLALLGLASGFGIGAFGSFLPMPKDPPIMQDLMQSQLGAWMMLLFGVTAAPLLEELAFRGFLLPGLINTFRWLAQEGKISAATVKGIGIPVSILITSAGFAYMHSPQVSHAWGPLVLIGMVSVVLCIVRLTMQSLAASVIVHAAYNFTLFAGMLIETGGFRHLERMTG